MQCTYETKTHQLTHTQKTEEKNEQTNSTYKQTDKLKKYGNKFKKQTYK